MVDTDAYRAQFRARIPRWYRGWAHFALTNLFLGGATLALLAHARGAGWRDLWAVGFGFVASNAVEYFAHRFPLHRPMRPLRFIHRAHAIQHHRFFTADSLAHMTTSDPHDFAVVLFGPASQLGLILGLALPLALLLDRVAGRAPALLFAATACAYFLLYEWLHLAYHLPDTHPLARFPGIARLQRHHLRHHELRLMSKWNFNITFPLFDALCGTTYRPRDPAPDVARAPSGR